MPPGMMPPQAQAQAAGLPKGYTLPGTKVAAPAAPVRSASKAKDKAKRKAAKKQRKKNR
jgi:hypothetical protein